MLSFELEDYRDYNKMNYNLKIIRRFWSKVYIPKDYENECWIWKGSIDDNGYGFFSINYKMVRVHRFAYECCYNLIPNGLLVRHTCDNPPCVSPYHLLIGTCQDNSNDAVKRNRIPHGENHSNSKLTENDVKNILTTLYEGNYTCTEISNFYKVEPRNINRIASGKIWKNIYNQLTKEQKEKIKFNVINNKCLNSSNLTINDIKKIRELYSKNIKIKELIKIFNIRRQTISDIVNRKTWKHI
jgi:hypothetical protein